VVNSSATKYAAAPDARVTFNPNRMAMMMAKTEPKTLEAAFHRPRPLHQVSV